MLKSANTMSTNINDFTADENLLQTLVNDLFKKDGSYPYIAAVENQFAPPDANFSKEGLSNDFTPHPSSLPGFAVASPGISPSLGGAGLSPGIYNKVHDLNLEDPTPFLKEGPYSDEKKVPGSQSSGGISPSAHEQRNEVDLQNPQTALPDPHFPEEGKVPSSLAGSGASPSVKYLDQKDSSKPISKDGYLPDIEKILASISHYEPGPQLQSASGDLFSAAPSYYFIEQRGNPKTGEYSKPSFDSEFIKKDFPILSETVNGKPLIWLDNAATTQKPKSVIDRISYFYEHENSNVHRAAHELAARSTDAYEGAREKVRKFLHAKSAKEIIFVRGTTEAINLVANTFGEQFLQSGDEIILSHLEHHANIVPWQQLAVKKGLKIRVIPVDDDGQLILSEYEKLLNSKTKLVSFTQVSNALGTVTPAKQIIDLAHHAGAKVLLDGAQSVSHMRVDLQYLNPDFFVFSGHKIFGPTGIGVVYGKEEILNQLPPWQGGGNMIKDVTFEKTQFQDAPGRFEAGTGNIADAVGLGAALDYVTRLGIDHIYQYEHFLLQYATTLMKQVPGLTLIGTAADKASVLSFILKGYSNDEVGKALNEHGIAVRTGHHCAQPILRRFGLESTVRPSLAFYNTCSDVDTLVQVLHRLKRN
jgi:cysteine desulfurase / selenocysteine lyase